MGFTGDGQKEERLQLVISPAQYSVAALGSRLLRDGTSGTEKEEDLRAAYLVF